MRLTVLGGDGGVGAEQRTSCFQIDDDILIDAGTGLGDLDLDAMAAIDHILLTHIHMDHIACLPLMLDGVITRRQRPVEVHVPGADHEKLKRHIFNNVIWPDFTVIPSAENPVVRLAPMAAAYDFDGRRIGLLPANHHGESVGFWFDHGNGRLVFSGDTGPCPEFWKAVNAMDDVRCLIIECSFPNALEGIALASGHLTPALLAAELEQLDGEPKIYVSHIKPVGRAEVHAEIAALNMAREIEFLEHGQVIAI